MHKRLLLLFILFYSLCLTVQAQTDSTKLKRWNFGIGVLVGLNQLNPSTQLHYDGIDNNIGSTVSYEASLQFHFSKRWAASVSVRIGNRTTYSSFRNDMIGYNMFITQETFESPLLLCYQWRDLKQKEIISIEGGVSFGKTVGSSSYHTKFYEHANNITPYENEGGLITTYYSGIIKLDKSISLNAELGLKISMEYNLSYYNYPVVVQYDYHPQTFRTEQDYITFQNQILYVGMALIF